MPRSVRPAGSSERLVAAWLSSLLMHGGLLLLGLLLVAAPTLRHAGETLEFELHGAGEPFDPSLTLTQPAADPASDSAAESATPLMASETIEAPERTSPGGGGSGSPGSGPPGAVALASATSGRGSGGGGGPRRVTRGDFRFGHGHTKLFGLAGEGFRFVYVFDRSGSMGGSGRSALEVAKAELLASLAPLESTHQFQIVFYNELPKTFSIAGKPGRLVFATEANKRSAAEYVRSVSAGGITRHEEALASALAYFPDVVYFLTDADEPAMTEAELARITRLNGDHTVIHAIEFGLGPGGQRQNFLTRLAEQNGGEHVYVDFTSWRPESRDALPKN